MIRATRRGALAGALALPAVASLAKAPKRKASGTILLHDPSLEAGRSLTAGGLALSDKTLAIEGDRIRFARAVFDRAPALVIGVSRAADALLIEEVAREAGYEPVSAPQAVEKAIAGAKALDRGQARGWMFAPRL